MQSLCEGWSKTVKLISPEAKGETQSSPTSIPGVWCFFDHFFQMWNQVYLKMHTKAPNKTLAKQGIPLHITSLLIEWKDKNFS